jgi:hypothetical protein
MYRDTIYVFDFLMDTHTYMIFYFIYLNIVRLSYIINKRLVGRGGKLEGDSNIPLRLMLN